MLFPEIESPGHHHPFQLGCGYCFFWQANEANEENGVSWYAVRGSGGTPKENLVFAARSAAALKIAARRVAIFWGILPHFQPFDVEIGLLRAGDANSNETNAFARCFEGPGAANVRFLVDFHQNGGFGVLLGDFTKDGMEITKFHTFY